MTIEIVPNAAPTANVTTEVTGDIRSTSSLWSAPSAPDSTVEVTPTIEEATEEVVEEESVSEEEHEDEEAEGEEDAQADSEESPEEGQEEEEARPEKTYRASTSNGEKLEVGSETKLKVKVDGRFKWVPVSKLVSKYNGEVVYSERFAELKRKEQEIESKARVATQSTEKTKALVQNMVDAFTKDEYDTALLTISEITGQDPVKFSTTLIQGMHKLLVQLGSMSAEGQQAWMAQLENKALKTKTENDKTTSQKRAFIDEQNRILEGYTNRFGFGRDEYAEAAKWLVEENKMERSKITADMLATVALNKRIEDNITSVLEDIGETLDAPTRKYIADLAWEKETQGTDSLEASDYEQLIRTRLGLGASQAKKNLSRKVSSTGATPKRPNKKIAALDDKPMRLMDRWASL